MLRLIWFLPRDIASVVYTMALCLCPSNAITRQWHNVRTTDIPFPFPLSFLPISSFLSWKGWGWYVILPVCCGSDSPVLFLLSVNGCMFSTLWPSNSYQPIENVFSRLSSHYAQEWPLHWKTRNCLLQTSCLCLELNVDWQCQRHCFQSLAQSSREKYPNFGGTHIFL